MSAQFSVTTANTQFNTLLHSKDGFANIQQSDILLLQEVSNPKQEKLAGVLQNAGYKPVHIAEEFGLVIALRIGSQLMLELDSLRSRQFAHFNLVEKILAAIAAPGKHSFNRRGIIAVKLRTKSGVFFTVATTHLAVAMTPKSRTRQLIALQTELSNVYYAGALILGADMNHYPGPEAADEAMWQATNLTPVDLHGRPTWVTKRSKLLVLAQLVSLIRHKNPKDYDGQLDDILYRSPLVAIDARIVEIPSDHNAITATFELPH